MRFTITVDMPDNARSRLRAALRLLGATAIRILAVEGKLEPVKRDNVPTSPVSIAVAELFGRTAEQEWSEKEIKAFRDATRRRILTEETMPVIAAYYKAERAKGTGTNGGMHRRDLMTFLNNASGELDRAKAYKEKKRPSAGPGWLPGSTPVVLPPLTEEEKQEAQRFEAMRKRTA